MSYLEAELTVRRGDFELDLAVTVRAGEVLAVLGPNGAGKSTLLGALTGQYPATHARIVLDGDEVHRRPTYRRGISLLAQDPTLFPHLNAEANVAFGPRAAGVGKNAAHAQARELLAQVDAADFARRKPAALSGGQAARVALARALAVAPKLLLLDEPFAALDVDSAPRMRALVASVLAEHGMSALLVTHDPLDALVLADRVAVLDAGRVVETGPVREVLSAPSTAFAARITGTNLVTGVGEGSTVRTASGELVYGTGDVQGAAVAVFAPTAVTLHPHRPEGSARNVCAATVSRVEPHGDLVRVRLSSPGWADGISADVTATAVSDLDIAPGRELFLAVKATEVALHPKRAP